MLPEDVPNSDFLVDTPMVVGLLEVELFLPDALNLKDKRSVIKSLKDQLHGRFNVAVAELNSNVKWQRATLGLTTVATDRASVDECLRHVVQWIETNRFAQIVRVQQEVL
jgi:uncharacterized protein YlxP (DUF503 family)